MKLFGSIDIDKSRGATATGVLTACAIAAAAFSACSNPLMKAAEAIKADAVSPKIVVSQSDSKAITSGSLLDYGNITSGSSMDVELIIANEGKSALDIDLTNLRPTMGADTEADTFSIGVNPSGRISAGASSTMIVTFTPSADGTKTATISLPTNDTKNQVFFFTVKGARSSIAIATTAVSSIATTSATGGGTIPDAGGQSISTRGICWDILPNPTIDDSIVAVGSGSGDFSGIMTNLNAGTLYYVRAYASSEAGYTYGPQKSFMTLPEAPMAPTVSALGYSAGSGKLAVVWNAVTGASIYDLYYGGSISFPSAQSPISTTSTTYTVSGLTNFATYYFWIKARNASGSSEASPTMASPVMVGVKVESITLSKSSATFLNGSSETITATCSPSTATLPGVIWTTSNPSIAAVSGGNITGGTIAGSATITVTAADGQGASASFAATTKAFAVGTQGPAGGILVYDAGDYSKGWRYLEAAPVNVGAGLPWSPISTSIPTAANTGLGDGLPNTLAIISALGDGNYMASACRKYSLNGYSDWFMPSRSEADSVLANALGIPGIQAILFFETSSLANSTSPIFCHAYQTYSAVSAAWSSVRVTNTGPTIVTRPTRRF